MIAKYLLLSVILSLAQAPAQDFKKSHCAGDCGLLDHLKASASSQAFNFLSIKDNLLVREIKCANGIVIGNGRVSYKSFSIKTTVQLSCLRSGVDKKTNLVYVRSIVGNANEDPYSYFFDDKGSVISGPFEALYSNGTAYYFRDQNEDEIPQLIIIYVVNKLSLKRSSIKFEIPERQGCGEIEMLGRLKTTIIDGTITSSRLDGCGQFIVRYKIP